MENTGKVYFDDDTPQWYIASGESWVGPLSASDVYQKVTDQQITLAHYVWKQGQPSWKRICDIETFQAAAPTPPVQGPPPVPGKQPKAPPPPITENKLWYLHYNDAQFGPFSGEDIRRFIRVGKIHARVHVWRDGMENWKRLGEVADFAAEFNAPAPPKASAPAPARPPAPEAPRARPAAPAAPLASVAAAQAAEDKRVAPRSPMVARILVAASDSISVAVCRDVSVGGMQVLTDKVPGSVGSRLKMNVTPAVEGKQARFQPFVAEGTIVRILEDGRGFSFRFERLSDQARASIEDYIRDTA